MGATLQTLLELQDIELQIVDIRGQLAARERRVRAQENRLQEARGALQTERDELRRSQAVVDELDLELKTRTEHANRLREHLNTVKTNKEYAAVLSQLNTEKADASRLEGRALELMGGLEARKGGVTEHAEAARRAQTRLDDSQAQLEQTCKSFTPRLEALEKQRREIAERLDGRALTLFERVSERYDGEVLAQVVRTHPRRDEFICDGCHMGLSAEVANALLTRDEVRTCQSCGRILHIEKGT